MAFGVATEAMNRRVNEREGAKGQAPGPMKQGAGLPSGADGGSSFERGDTKLSRLAGNIRPDAHANPLQDGMQGFLESRQKAVSSVANVGSAVVSGKVDLKDFKESMTQMTDQVTFSAKAVKVAGQGQLDTRDGVRIAGAGAKHAGEKALAALAEGDPLAAAKGLAVATKSGAEGAFATATVSDAGMGTLTEAIDARTRHETKKVLTSAALSTGAGVLAGMVNPGLGLAVRTVGGLALGHQIGEAADKIHGGSQKGEVGAMRAEFRKLVEEKA
ncbi:MAG TPA: hypothetical protein VFZ09_21450 [Archangium sp.]|uniref:hypothetical protein n=1 Tax=Archangium sp. TaxID=1872627 RepID=UPI002E2FD8F6|nr:hypothetical protein [Archangium sp.]HEX5748821.1 hypothetical protein [Archangium sp.]